jgi:O-antigen/teichoic acid export membrane protein
MTPLKSSPRLLSFCFKLVLVLLLAYLLLSGFIWMIGGTAIYVSSAVLFVITAYAFKLGKYQKLCAVLNVLMSAVALYFSTAHLFFSYSVLYIFTCLIFCTVSFCSPSKFVAYLKYYIH